MVAGTGATVIFPIITLAVRIKYKSCKKGGSKFPIACTLATPFGLPPPVSFYKVITRERTILESIAEQKEAVTEALAESGVDPEIFFEGTARGILKRDKPEEIIKSAAKQIKTPEEVTALTKKAKIPLLENNL